MPSQKQKAKGKRQNESSIAAALFAFCLLPFTL
jgi:hypothetical protein